jgi:glycosyltransferase involved in cell wall biosynthesis
MIKRHRFLLNVAGGGLRSTDRGGAIERIVGGQIDWLAARHEVTVFGDLGPLGRRARVVPFGRRVYYKRRTTRGDLTFHVLGLARMLRINSDIVVSTHQRNFFLSYIYARIRQKPLVAWELDHIFWSPPWTAIKRVYHRFVTRADLVISISSAQRDAMLARGVDSDRIITLYNPVDVRKYAPGREPGGPPTVLYVAKFAQRKNQLGLLRAFVAVLAEYPETRLRLVGAASGAYTSVHRRPSKYYEECMTFVRRNGLSERVIVEERITEMELVEAYRGATVFVFPSVEEGFGLALAEAMACGCLCVSNDVDPMKEVLGDTGLLVDATDPSELAKAIIAVLRDPGLKFTLGRRARERAVWHFARDALNEDFERHALELLRGRALKEGRKG